MRLAEHLTALRAWRKQCLPGLVKTPRRHSMDARVYGHTTTAMHKLSTPPPPPPRPRPRGAVPKKKKMHPVSFSPTNMETPISRTVGTSATRLSVRLATSWRVNPFRAPKPLPILNPSNVVPQKGFPVVKGLTRTDSQLLQNSQKRADVPTFCEPGVVLGFRKGASTRLTFLQLADDLWILCHSWLRKK